MCEGRSFYHPVKMVLHKIMVRLEVRLSWHKNHIVKMPLRIKQFIFMRLTAERDNLKRTDDRQYRGEKGEVLKWIPVEHHISRFVGFFFARHQT